VVFNLAFNLSASSGLSPCAITTLNLCPAAKLRRVRRSIFLKRISAKSFDFIFSFGIIWPFLLLLTNIPFLVLFVETFLF